jgi:hypothetical protein
MILMQLPRSTTLTHLIAAAISGLRTVAAMLLQPSLLGKQLPAALTAPLSRGLAAKQMLFPSPPHQLQLTTAAIAQQALLRRFQRLEAAAVAWQIPLRLFP